MREPLKFSGIMPANILPFKADLSVDEPAYRKHLRWLADTPGVTGIVVNGHAAEVASLSRDERRRTLAIALDEVAGACPVIAGVYTDGTAEAVELTAMYFKRWRRQNHDKPPHFLWNAKMRFGKTFAAYQLAKRMGWRRVLVLTFKPAVQSAWEEDLQRHVDFAGWQFIRPGGLLARRE